MTTKEIAANVNSYSDKSEKTGFSFYQKIFFLYFLNIIDWLCTEALISSGKFYEANPIMQPVLENFWLTILVKGVLPLVLVALCAVVYKIADTEEGLLAKILLNVGIVAYVLVNVWHILNFVLLFYSF